MESFKAAGCMYATLLRIKFLTINFQRYCLTCKLLFFCGYFWFICQCDTNFVTFPSAKRYTDNAIEMSLVNGSQRLVCWLGIIAQGSAYQDFEEIH